MFSETTSKYAEFAELDDRAMTAKTSTILVIIRSKTFRATFITDKRKGHNAEKAKWRRIY